MTRALVLLAVLGVAGCNDPVRDDAIDALGGEAPGVPEGPLHRPGQPCVLCHGGSGPGDSDFIFAGTVYQTDGPPVPLEGVLVRLIDARGVKYETGTNCAGNFFVQAADYEPEFPVWAKVIYGVAGGVPVQQVMSSPIYRERSCATCHGDPKGRESTGHIYVAPEGVPFPPGAPCR